MTTGQQVLCFVLVFFDRLHLYGDIPLMLGLIMQEKI